MIASLSQQLGVGNQAEDGIRHVHGNLPPLTSRDASRTINALQEEIAKNSERPRD